MSESPDELMARIRRQMLEDTIALRTEIMTSVPTLSLEALATRFGKSLEETNRWVEELRCQKAIVAVDYGRERLYPAFQFDEHGAKPIVRQIIEFLTPTYNDWDILCWFAGATGWLGGASPYQELDKCPEAVLKAAEQELLD